MRMNVSRVESESETADVVDACLDRARAAMDEIADYDQERIDELVQAVAWAIYEDKRPERSRK